MLNKNSAYSLNEDFLKRHLIEEDDLGWLGKGDNGDAYSCSDGRVLKVTRSQQEFTIAQRLIGHHFDNLVEYYAAEKIDGVFYLLMEELELIDEDEYHDAERMLSTQGLSFAHVDYFDEDDYKEETGDEPDMSFINEMHEVVIDLRRAGIGDRADIRPENLGRDSHGTLKAFDIQERV